MNFVKKIPLVKKLINKFNNLENSIKELSDDNIRLRFKLKVLNKEKINVVFVCWRPAVWGSLKTVYEAMKDDDKFNVKIVTIPNKKQLPKKGLNHEIYESEGAENFWTDKNVIQGYNYETKEWFDLRLLKADYICFQQPYNVCRTVAEKSWAVRKYAKIFYVHYASNFIGSGILKDSNPPDFINDVALYFNQSKSDYDLINTYLKNLGNSFTKTFLTGFPRYDNLNCLKYVESDIWNFPKSDKKFRIVWTPRWCTNEGNCNFFEYKDLLLSYCKINKDIDFVFRPHPQAFLNWSSTGELPDSKAKEYRLEYQRTENAKVDESCEYLSTFYSSDCLITDISSIVAEYFLTGKPIIYCHKKDCFNDFSKKLSEGFYWVNNWNELKKTLEMLKKGEDPLKEIRLRLIKNEFFIPPEGAGHMIKEIIKSDFLNS